MDSFRQVDNNVLAQVDTVFTDVDDTLTRHGKLSPSALAATAAQLFLREELGLSADEQQRRTLFIGDAPNDETMFRTFALGVGVANIRPHLQQLTHRPRWLCEASHFDGFVTMAERLLAAHQGDSERT